MIGNLIVDICNGAIRKSGQDGRITSIDENSNLGDLCRDAWEPTINFIYAAHPWAFKKIRAQADLKTVGNDKIATQGMNVFGYPGNALRILGFYQDREQRRKEPDARVSSDKDGNRIILGRAVPLFIEFIMDATSNDSVSPWLREVIELKLGMEIARAKGRDIRILQAEYQQIGQSARENNASESEEVQVENDEYINARG